MTTLLLIIAIAVAIWFYIKLKDVERGVELPVKIVITTEYRTGVFSPEESQDPDHDNWEGAFWDVQSPRTSEGKLRINYRDGAGAETTRDIDLMKYGLWEGGAILWAYCHLRKANRTFRTDRILSCIDRDTGEIIDNLQSWLDVKYQSSPDRAIEAVIESSWDAIRVLYYVSKADGRLTQKERAILREAIRSMSNHPAIDDKRIDDMLQTIDIPSITAFKQAFGRLLNQKPDLAANVVTWCKAMVASEKTMAAAEQEAIDYLQTRINKQ